MIDELIQIMEDVDEQYDESFDFSHYTLENFLGTFTGQPVEQNYSPQYCQPQQNNYQPAYPEYDIMGYRN